MTTPYLRRAGLAALVFAAFCTSRSNAAEFGDIRVHSWLGRQLKASVPLAGDDARESDARCFKAALLNLNQEVVSNLKVTLQHSSRSSVLLLAGGSTVDEPAATVRVENVCGSGERRDFAVLLDLVPDSLAAQAPLAIPPAEPVKVGAATREAPEKPVQQRAPMERNGEPVVRNEPKPEPVPARPILIAGLKLAALLSNPDAGGAQANSPAAGNRAILDTDASFKPALKLEPSLAKAAGAGSDDSPGQKAMFVATLGIIAAFAAAAWIFMRIREMKTAAKPWMPVDMMLDADIEASAKEPART
ncbi:MAG TPA: hypothetical protein VEC35_19380 [Noviherbaspirillum sp.]|nr:hypothetical protein [Noviherbaspirillum sp.]